MIATLLLLDNASVVWKTVAWRGIKVRRVFLRIRRELIKEKKIGISDTNEKDHCHRREREYFQTMPLLTAPSH